MEAKTRFQLAALSVAGYVALALLIPHIPLPHSQWAVLGLVILSTVVFMAVQVALIRWVVSLPIKAPYAVLAMAVSLALFLAGWRLHALSPLLIDLLRMAFLTMLGYLVSLAIREPNLLLPAAIFAPIFDITTVFWGPARLAVHKAPKVVQAVSSAIPAPGAMKPILMVGPGDIAFLAIFFAVIYRFDMNARRTYWLMLPLVLLTMFLVFGYFMALPGLVPMSIAVIAANWRFFKLTRQEQWSLGLAGLVVLGIVAAAISVFMGKH